MNFKEKRWFAEKDAVIEDIATEDSFYLSSDIMCFIKRFCLKRRNDERVVKRYFIPEIADAEQTLQFQQAILHQYNSSGNIPTSNGGVVRFCALIPMPKPVSVECPVIRFGSSNVLTIIHTDKQSIVSKIYKDMRGDCGRDGRIWLPNPEAARYEALAKAGYSNIPKVYGIAYYYAPNGEKTPLNLIMEAVQGRRRIGEIFADSLNRLENTDEICCFADQTARSVAQMHAAFLNSGMPGFDAVQATDADKLRWAENARNNFEQAMSSLKQIIPPFLKRGWEDFGMGWDGLMKAQVHGDLHADQGLLEGSVIKWLDFEGPPAKEYVPKNYDSRENLLTDLAGMVQAFWYMAHIRLYEFLGLDYQNSEDHEKQRKASLMFVGLILTDASLKPFIDALKLWLNNITTAFIDGYLDEAENLAIQRAILTKWDRNSARDITIGWVLARAAHELRYETYGRNWGWEGIPASRIFQISAVSP
jgi:predicted trehalose synthase